MLISLKRVDDFTYLPINLAMVKSYLKIDHDIEDELLLILIKSAIEQCEECTRLSLSKKQWLAIYKRDDKFDEVILPKKPVTQVMSISGDDFGKEKLEIHKKFYYLFEDRLIFKQIPFFTKIYINFEAGYDKDIFSEAIKTILFEHVADMYEKRNINSNFSVKKYRKFRSMKL